MITQAAFWCKEILWFYQTMVAINGIPKQKQVLTLVPLAYWQIVSRRAHVKRATALREGLPMGNRSQKFLLRRTCAHNGPSLY